MRKDDVKPADVLRRVWMKLDHASSAPRTDAEVVGSALLICRGELAWALLWLPAQPPIRSAYAGRSVPPDGRRQPSAVAETSGKPCRIFCRCITCRGKNSAIVNCDYVHGLVDVGDDAPHLRAGELAGLGAQAEHDLVAIDCVDVEMDGHT